MTLVELNKIIEGDYVETASQSLCEKNVCASEEEHQMFKNMLIVNDIYSSNLNITEDYKEFFEAFEFFKKVFDESKWEDLFYTAKLGFRFEGVPSKLTFILRKAIMKYESPNLAVSAIDSRSWGRFLKKGILPEGITIKMVIDNLLGTSYDTLTDYRRKVKFKDWYEVYVGDANRVLLLPESLANNLSSLNDLSNVHYVKDVGVMVYDKLIRTMEPFIGVTADEFDLRKVM